jgi:hypothetical protein
MADMVECFFDPNKEPITVAASHCQFHEHATGEENCYRTKYIMPEVFRYNDPW